MTAFGARAGIRPAPRLFSDPTFLHNTVGMVTLDRETRQVGFYILDGNDKTVLSHGFAMDALHA